jgi:hypothetical protein
MAQTWRLRADFQHVIYLFSKEASVKILLKIKLCNGKRKYTQKPVQLRSKPIVMFPA